MTARGGRHGGRHARRPEPVRHRTRRWWAATALTPTLVLAGALVGASASYLATPPQEPDRPRPAAPDLRDVGVTGRLPAAPAPSPELLDRAAERRPFGTGAGPEVAVPDGPLGIPAPVLAAYREGADGLSGTGCGLHWSVLASIGRIESGHARGGRLDAEGTTVEAILGPRLSGGPGVAAVPDTDRGELDGDPVWDRAVGPMQFIPGTWAKFSADGNDDGARSPHNVHDAVAAAGRFLCSGGADLGDERELARAVFRYNHSDEYVRTVLAWARAYAEGVTPTPAEPMRGPTRTCSRPAGSRTRSRCRCRSRPRRASRRWRCRPPARNRSRRSRRRPRPRRRAARRPPGHRNPARPARAARPPRARPAPAPRAPAPRAPPRAAAPRAAARRARPAAAPRAPPRTATRRC
ncbi:lytic transglycosylase domain-containing protein [Saccharopolyspora sp. CA-218241]|uniref:lytic transglycosylase domain-containing protein n=1 Tax=Saccharopolyspora sp. CA-218241 TaxID=3240027 RepID=UPI003D98C76C